MQAPSPLRLLFATVGAGLVLASCAVAPKAPNASLPPSALGAFAGSTTPAVTGTAARDDWWRLYQDPVLDGLVLQALAENNELEAAAANLRRVRAAYRETRIGLFPTSSASTSVQYGRPSASAMQGGPPATTPIDEETTYDVGLDIAYEVDLFGRIGSTINAARADADAAEAGLDAARVSVAAETARAYADACSANAQIAVAERNIELQTNTVSLTQRLLDSGAGNGLDLARARTTLESTRASLPPLRAQREGALFRLATLTGRTPAQVSTAAKACLRPPQLSAPVPVGDGAQLLARRPDVRRAERNLAAAAARVNVAVANLYPRITLGGSLGSTALSAGGLSNDENYRFSVGPLISWSFANVLTSRSRIAQAGANSEAALATFDQTVLVALQETETALSGYANELDRRSALQRARDEAANAARLSRLRFNAGADSFLPLLDAERTLASADAQLAASEALVTTYQINLFRALAGGWRG